MLTSISLSRSIFGQLLDPPLKLNLEHRQRHRKLGLWLHVAVTRQVQPTIVAETMAKVENADLVGKTSTLGDQGQRSGLEDRNTALT
jgi:hypothetical protein